MLYFDEFFSAYLECAFWSSVDDSNDEREPLDENYGISDLDSDALKRLEDEAKRFYMQALEIGIPETSEDAQLAGHDFWLTRNGHGAGFWDGDWGDQGDALTKASEAFGTADLYIGDDKKVYLY